MPLQKYFRTFRMQQIFFFFYFMFILYNFQRKPPPPRESDMFNSDDSICSEDEQIQVLLGLTGFCFLHIYIYIDRMSIG